MILFLAEASRQFGCTEIFKEPSKFAWSDRYEDHFLVPYNRIVLITNRRIMLLQVGCQIFIFSFSFSFTCGHAPLILSLPLFRLLELFFSSCFDSFLSVFEVCCSR